MSSDELINIPVRVENGVVVTYAPTEEIKNIHYSHDHNYNPATTQDDYDRWQLDLLHHHMAAMEGENLRRAQRTAKALTKRIIARRLDEIDLDPIITARACIERLKARAV